MRMLLLSLLLVSCGKHTELNMVTIPYTDDALEARIEVLESKIALMETWETQADSEIESLKAETKKEFDSLKHQNKQHVTKKKTHNTTQHTENE